MLGFEAHHDGSPLYLPDGPVPLGDTTRVRMRSWAGAAAAGAPDGGPSGSGTPDGGRPAAVGRVWLRTVEDGEPRYAEARRLASTDGWDWWEAELHAVNPLVRYRFLLRDPEGRITWLNAAGVHAQDVPDAQDFRLATAAPGPDWAAGAVMYQVFPDRFGRSAEADTRTAPDWAVPADWDADVVYQGPYTPLQFFGGDLDGVRERLDHLTVLGVEVLYLTPFFPSGSNHRYDAESFRRVDPLLGGDEALIRLVEACHERGIRVIGDLTTNHTGDTHEWFRTALADPGTAERSFYYFRPDGSYESWWGVPSLPKLDWASDGLRREFVEGPKSVVAHWLNEPFRLDGWRVDVGNMTGRLGAADWNHEVASLVRNTALEACPDALLVAESTSDAAPDFQGDTYHGSMSYASFTRPLWAWLSDGTAVNYFGLPLPHPPRITAAQFVAEYRTFAAAYPWTARLHSLVAIDTHDTARAATAMIPGGQAVAAVLSFTLPGMPTVFAGDEFGLEGMNGEHSRTPMPWDSPQRVVRDLRALYSGLGALRREQVLRTGSLRWLHADADTLAFVRELDGSTVLVVAARDEADAVLPAELLPAGLGVGAKAALAVGRLALGTSDDGGIRFRAAGPAAAVWLLG
ncbi:hypothetical protein BIU82_15450 [Arthrobacter sp. SW1]|uniref:glycoside hydrolase family 13 protein n=1 Tax=Arthrobacter sp. SW1 TaxID=1920889 RepID=UPI000877B5B3|nr:glycoside hydrolase family 13 protein [Arthrobacter sp. SW1]OFI39249.1 hypothetical protein BIU82_15450 [Arthrobacter sp. SW1]